MTPLPPSSIGAAPQAGKSDLLSGMSLRDYFAAKAMQAAFADTIANPDKWDFAGKTMGDSIALMAYEMADAMMRARAEQP